MKHEIGAKMKYYSERLQLRSLNQARGFVRDEREDRLRQRRHARRRQGRSHRPLKKKKKKMN